MNTKNAFNFLLMMATTLILSGCLPEQKTTQCGKDEAFNATRRICVPVIGQASSSTVFIKNKFPSNSYTTSINSGAVNHSISVSDVYNYGYATKWFMHFTSGGTSTTTEVAANTTTFSLNPAFTYGAGSYVIEAVVYNDDGENLDAVSWNITINGDITPSITNPVPNAGSFSYASNINSASLGVDLSNADSVSGAYYWILDGNVTSSGSFNGSTSSLTNTIYPIALGVGIHTVEIKITNTFSASDIYDSYVWIINVVDPDLPILTTADPGYNHTLLAVNGLAYTSGGWMYDHDDDGNASTPLELLNVKAQTGTTQGLCVNVDNWDKDGDGTADVYLKFDVNGAQMGPVVYLTANTYCLNDDTDLPAQILANAEIGASKTLTVTTYRNGIGTEVEQRSWALNIMPTNSAPIIQISSNTDASLACTSTSSSVYHTGCVAAQSYDDDLDGAYSGAEDNLVKFSIDVVEDYETDYNSPSTANGEDQSAVYFQIRRAADASFQDINGASDYTKADCVVASGSSKTGISEAAPTGAITTYSCSISFDAFKSTGPIDSGDFVVKAYITDAGSSWGGIPKNSNSVTWEVSVTEERNSPTINTQSLASIPAAPYSSASSSYITTATTATGCTASSTVVNSTTPIVEGNTVVVHTIVKDIDRDHLVSRVRLDNAVSGGDNTVSAWTTTTRTDEDEYIRIESCFQVPEWAATSGTATPVNLYVDVYDIRDDLTHGTTQNQTFALYVTNNNPAPEFDDYSSGVENTDDLAATNPTYVFPGFPFTITPPTYTDDSVYDGTVVSWKWQECNATLLTCDVTDSTGTDWVDIPGGDSTSMTNPNLVWTPDPSLTAGTSVSLRLCLGDDGDGNPTDCSNQASRKSYTNIVVNPASAVLDSNTILTSSGTELASWYDETNGYQYIAYASGSTMAVEKLSADEFGQWATIHRIVFSTDPVGGQNPYDISMTGEDGVGIVIAYRIYESTNNNPVVRVRRIDISNDKLSFNYTGVYDDSESADTDMITGTAGAANNFVNATFTETATNGVQIAFTALPTTGETITFYLADGIGAISVSYDSTDWCDGGCLDTAATATALSTFINSHARLSQELVSTIPVGGTVQIEGPQANDYLDIDDELAMYQGDIFIYNSKWYIPFVDGSSNSRAAMVSGTAVGTSLDGLSPSIIRFNSTQSNLTGIQMASNSNSEFVIAATGTANLHAYLIDGFFSVLASSVNVHDLTGITQIKDISISIDQTDDTVHVAGISEDSSGDTFLNMAVFAADLSEVSSTSFFTGLSNLLTARGIDQVKVSSSGAGDGEAVLAITTNSTHDTIAQQAHLVKVSQDTGDFTQPIVFNDHQMFSVASSPKLNDNDIFNNSAIALSPIITLTKGHADEASASSSASADNAQPAVFFTYHENNTGTAEVKTGIFNVSEESMTANDHGTGPGYPALISN